MGYKIEIISGAGPSGSDLKKETWSEERFSVRGGSPIDFGPYASIPNRGDFIDGYYPKKALSIRNTRVAGQDIVYDSGDGNIKYYLHHPTDIHSYVTEAIRSRKLRNIIPISDNVDSDFYGGFVTERHFQLSLDVLPVSKTEVAVVVNRGRFNYEKKELKGQVGPTGESLYEDFPLYYGDNSDNPSYTGVTHLVPYNYQSSVMSFPFQSNFGVGHAIKNSEDFPENYTKSQFLRTLRFGSDVREVIPVGNPVIDKKIPSLRAAEKDELLYVFYKNIKEEDVDIGNYISFPYRNGDSDFEEYFLTLNSIDGEKYKSNKDYIVIILGSFDFKDGVVSNKRGPFNFNFGPGKTPIYKFGEKTP